jgi:hypothetical protein
LYETPPQRTVVTETESGSGNKFPPGETAPPIEPLFNALTAKSGVIDHLYPEQIDHP